MLKQWFHGAAVVASLFTGMPYWHEEDTRSAKRAPANDR